MIVRVNVDLYGPHGAGWEMDRLIAGPGGATVAAFEKALVEGTLVTEQRAHVITGGLKASVHPDSQLGFGEWTGEILAARHPGIYELARGNMPTQNHPEGGHYFFDPGGPEFEKQVREALWDWVTHGMAGPAPIEGLGPWSGGY